MASSSMQCIEAPHSRNLLRNFDAQDGLNHWEVPDGVKAPVVEDPFWGATPLDVCVPFAGSARNWVTSFEYGAMTQEVDLKERGFPEYLLDQLRPPVACSVWYCGRSGCGSKFRFTVELLNGSKQELVKKEEEIDMTDHQLRCVWHSMDFDFRNYPSGLRFVRVTMGGVDTKYWKGNYGAKFTLPTVRLVLS